MFLYFPIKTSASVFFAHIDAVLFMPFFQKEQRDFRPSISQSIWKVIIISFLASFILFRTQNLLFKIEIIR